MIFASGFSDFLGNIWFAGLALVIGVAAGWLLRGKYGNRV